MVVCASVEELKIRFGSPWPTPVLPAMRPLDGVADKLPVGRRRPCGDAMPDLREEHRAVLGDLYPRSKVAVFHLRVEVFRRISRLEISTRQRLDRIFEEVARVRFIGHMEAVTEAAGDGWFLSTTK